MTMSKGYHSSQWSFERSICRHVAPIQHPLCIHLIPTGISSLLRIVFFPESSLTYFAFGLAFLVILNLVFDGFEFSVVFFSFNENFSFEIFKSLAFFQQGGLIDSHHACLTSGWRMMIQSQVSWRVFTEGENPSTIHIISLKILRHLCIFFLLFLFRNMPS